MANNRTILSIVRRVASKVMEDSLLHFFLSIILKATLFTTDNIILLLVMSNYEEFHKSKRLLLQGKAPLAFAHGTSNPITMHFTPLHHACENHR